MSRFCPGSVPGALQRLGQYQTGHWEQKIDLLRVPALLEVPELAEGITGGITFPYWKKCHLALLGPGLPKSVTFTTVGYPSRAPPGSRLPGGLQRWDRAHIDRHGLRNNFAHRRHLPGPLIRALRAVYTKVSPLLSVGYPFCQLFPRQGARGIR